MGRYSVRKSLGNQHFAKLLDDNSEKAIAVAQEYLLRGIGTHRPNPALRGVDRITVKCVRQFGVTTSDQRNEKLGFLLKWENNRERAQLLHELNLPAIPCPDKEVVLKQYMARTVQPLERQKSSAEFEVNFIGSSGSWSATFFVGCSAFQEGAVVERLNDENDSVDDFVV